MNGIFCNRTSKTERSEHSTRYRKAEMCNRLLSHSSQRSATWQSTMTLSHSSQRSATWQSTMTLSQHQISQSQNHMKPLNQKILNKSIVILCTVCSQPIQPNKRRASPKNHLLISSPAFTITCNAAQAPSSSQAQQPRRKKKGNTRPKKTKIKSYAAQSFPSSSCHANPKRQILLHGIVPYR